MFEVCEFCEFVSNVSNIIPVLLFCFNYVVFSLQLEDLYTS